jgi:hypothetical protein
MSIFLVPHFFFPINKIRLYVVLKAFDFGDGGDEGFDHNVGYDGRVKGDWFRWGISRFDIAV